MLKFYKKNTIILLKEEVMSKSVKRNDIIEGMVISSDQVNRYGQVLIKKGTYLVVDHKRLLQTWGIDRINVEDNNSSNEESPHMIKKIQEVEKKLEIRMLWQPSNIYEMDMHRAVIKAKMEE